MSETTLTLYFVYFFVQDGRQYPFWERFNYKIVSKFTIGICGR